MSAPADVRFGCGEALLSVDARMVWMFGGVLVVLVLASAIGLVLERRARGERALATVENLNARTRAWWKMVTILAVALGVGRGGSLVLFAALSVLALREYRGLMPARRGDHRMLIWSFFVIAPLQYWLIWRRWYGLYAVMIPVVMFVLAPTRMALSGDTRNFLERLAKLQFGVMICVYCLSYAPALLMLRIPGYGGRDAALLLYLVLVVQMSDVFKYVWGKLLGRHRIAPLVSPNKTWEGFVGGVLTATGVGAALWWATPFSPLEAAGISLMIALLGAGGGLVMSAIKRDTGVKDFGVMIEGHGGVLDRVDSLCFAAPIFFHVVRYFYAGGA